MEQPKKEAAMKALPYVSFATFDNALSSLVEQGLPSQIDRSVLKQFSGVNQNLLFTAFRFMGLTNEKGEPTDKLQEYEKGDAEKRKTILATLLKERYPEQVKILPNGTPQKLKDSFNSMNVESSVKAKCISFFLKTARAAGLPISAHIQKGARGTRTRGPRKDTGKKRNGASHTPPPEHEEELQEGMVLVPISVGVGKTWSVIVDEKHTQDDVDKFVQIIQITLGDGKKK
ncbi:MAG: DUF5343 domain-containing protein [Nitrospiraceae bacterium]